MKKFITSLLLKVLRRINGEAIFSTLPEKTEIQEEVVESVEAIQTLKQKEPKVKKPKPPRLPELSPQERAARDITEMMEVPFLALSKNRKDPIIYEKHDGLNMIKVKVSRHTGHLLASI